MIFSTFGTNIVGLVILFVPIASIWYLLRNTTGLVEDDCPLDELFTNHENLAYGSDSEQKNSQGETAPVNSAADSSGEFTDFLNSPPKAPKSKRSKKAKISKQSELDHTHSGTSYAFTAAKDGRVHVNLQVESQDGFGSGTEFVNAGSMQVKGIRSVGGDLEDYMSRD